MSKWSSRRGAARRGGVVAVRLVRQARDRTLFPDVVFAFHDTEEVGPRVVANTILRLSLNPGYFVVSSLEKIQLNDDSTRQRPDRQALFDIASEQDGYFTAEQAAACGYAPDMLSYHASTGVIRRVYRGVYRFRDYPSSSHEDVVAAWLAIGKDQAVVSHDSALELWDLSDVVPAAVHLTVPRSYRSRAKPVAAGRGHSHDDARAGG